MAISYEQLKSQIDILAVDENQAGAMVGKKSIFQLMVKAGWVAPIVERKSCTLYAVAHVRAAFEKFIKLGYEALVTAAQERA